MDYFSVNWTLFPNFDKNIEYPLECKATGMEFYDMADVYEGKHECSPAFTSMKISLPLVKAFYLH